MIQTLFYSRNGRNQTCGFILVLLCKVFFCGSTLRFLLMHQKNCYPYKKYNELFKQHWQQKLSHQFLLLGNLRPRLKFQPRDSQSEATGVHCYSTKSPLYFNFVKAENNLFMKFTSFTLLEVVDKCLVFLYLMYANRFHDGWFPIEKRKDSST